MEDNINFLLMDHNLNLFVNGKTFNLSILNNLSYFSNGRYLFSLLMEDNLNKFLNVRQSHFLTDGR